MSQVLSEPLDKALEMMRKTDAPEGEAQVDERRLNAERAQAYALIAIAESLKEIKLILERR
jgi:hypothetical protein